MKFTKNFSGICAPIVETIKKDNQPFYWIVTTNRSFNMLKRKVTEKPMLKFPDCCRSIAWRGGASSCIP